MGSSLEATRRYNCSMRMNFSEQQIEELRLICEEDFGRDVTPLEARQMAVTLFDLYHWLSDLIASGKVDHLMRGPVEGDVHVDSV